VRLAGHQRKVGGSTMLAALADAACSAATANSAGFGRWSSSLLAVVVSP
jgi:hypothetical protein